MDSNTSHSALSLRTKLVLSYLAVILGTVSCEFCRLASSAKLLLLI